MKKLLVLEDEEEDRLIPNTSSEDDEREEDNTAALYGSVYGDLMDSIENILIDMLERSESGYIFIPNEFSGNY